MTLDYVCVTCRTIGDNQFDYVLGIRRLEKAAVTKSVFQLREAVQREMLFRANILLPQEPVNNYPAVDPQAAYVIDNYVEGVSGNPRKTTGDGDCLFNAVSIVLKGDETLSTKLRYHTCLNLVNNMDRYMTHPLRPRIQHLSCSYESACFSAAKPGGYSSAWTILALSDAISMPIKVLYPFANGKNDIAYQTLNTEFTHEKTRQSDGAVYVLWHKLDTVPSNNNWYQVNHFSAVTEVTILEIEHERQTNVASTPVNCSKQEETTVSPISEISDIEDKSFRSPQRKRRKMSINVSPVEEHDNGLKTKNRFQAFSENDSDDEILGDEETAHDSEKSMANSSLTNISVAVDDCDENISESLLKNLPNGRFLSNAEFFDALLHTEPQANRIPPGEKSNVYMVLKHAGSNCSRMDFVDDCGIWETGTTVNQYFVVTNNCVNNVYKKDGQFSLKKLKDKKLEFVPIHPQPEDVITLHRYYAKLKGEDYRRRVSVVTHASDRLQGLTMTYIVEYTGHISRKERPPHGNAKSSESYKRTDPAIIRSAAERVGTKSATQIVNEMAADNSMFAPKAARQVQDRINYENKTKNNFDKQCMYSSHRKNVADDLLTIIGEINTNDFVQEIILTKGIEPIVILYHQSQIDDMRKKCSGFQGSIIGIDRTFNMGRFFVTAMSYKNRAVISRKTNQYPVLLGPICLQWNGEQSAYQKFFNHVREKLGSCDFTFGTDDEKAMRNALAVSFPESDFLLCTKHLKDNVRHYLQKHGTDEQTRQRVICSIFGEDGLVFSKDDFEFSQREDNLSVFFDRLPYFHTYYDRYLVNKLRKFVYKPLKEKKISKLWTNNNAESMNNRLKHETNRKILSAPQLLEKLSLVAKGHLIDLRRALYGSGNFKLFGPSRKFLIDENMWHQKSSNEKRRIFKKFISTPLPSEDSDYVQSRNAELKIKKPRENAGKKPGQRKRPAAERTSNVKHK